MNASSPSHRVWASIAAVLGLLVVLVIFNTQREAQPGKARHIRRSGITFGHVVDAPAQGPLTAPPPPGTGFAPQTRLGFTSGDQWEPSIAADRSGHVYVLYAQYLGVPGCADCFSPTLILHTSADGGATWALPAPIFPAGRTTGQWDPQIVVDPIDGRTVYAAWLQNGKSDIAVAKSTDFGMTWSIAVADSTNAPTDKPILAVRGRDVYVGYNHAQKVWVSSSHDGGVTFTSVNVNPNGKFGWSLAGGGTVDSSGRVHFAWAGYERNGGAKGSVNLYVSTSPDGGTTWTNTLMDISGAPPDCSAYLCGWAFLGAQLTMTSDPGGTLYTLWNANQVDKAPNRVYFASSTNGGSAWTARVDVSLAPANTPHAFPAIVAGPAGDVRIAWMDARANGLWNTYFRRSTDGGASWSPEVDLSTYTPGYGYIQPAGFGFPFGDYFEMDVDAQGLTHAVWGEALNYDTPGSIWYTKGK